MQDTRQIAETNHRYIHSFLLHMGVINRSKSSRRLGLALQYIIDNNIIPEYPMKCLYVDMAKQQKSTYSAVKLKPEERQYIHLSLLHLGVAKWSKSASRLKCAIEYVIETDAIAEVPIGHIYDYLVQKEGSSYGTIERSLRYIVDELWSNDPENCSRLFYRYSYALPCPRVSDFLTVYVSAFQRGIA